MIFCNTWVIIKTQETRDKIQVKAFWVVTPCRWRQQGPPKCWYPTATL